MPLPTLVSTIIQLNVIGHHEFPMPKAAHLYPLMKRLIFVGLGTGTHVQDVALSTATTVTYVMSVMTTPISPTDSTRE